MAAKLKKDDKVSWKFGRGVAHGVITELVSQDTTVATRKVKATKDDPSAVVKTDGGKIAVHKLQALKKEQR
ncbi:MAG: DUF2945 domain-containing protein [Candidatus Eremiobacteraeota bacterium]|nr:DUF2945 domain-containing protein [Candidatus Eremiobacteraeota bacterium]